MGKFTSLSELPKSTPADIEGVDFPSSLNNWVDGLPDDLLEVVSKIGKEGGGVWIVGGSIRQGLCGSIPNEYDLTTNFHPDKIMRLFPNSIPTGVDYGTVSVRLNHGSKLFEVTTLRCDQEYLDGRRPESVIFGNSLLADLERRDLTINSIAADLSRQKLYDPFHGREDLRNGILRSVGDAKTRLSEDGLRVMRAYRFMDQGSAGFWKPDEELSQALPYCQLMLKNVSKERIWNEFTKILSGHHASNVLECMSVDGTLNTIFSGSKYVITGQNNLTGINASEMVEARLALLLRKVDSEKLLRSMTAPKVVINGVSELINRFTHIPSCDEEKQLRLYRAVLGNRLNLQLACESAIDTIGIEDVKQALVSLPENQVGNKALADGNWLLEKTGLEKGIKLGRLKGWLHRIQIERDLDCLQQIEECLQTLSWEDGDPLGWPRVAWP